MRLIRFYNVFIDFYRFYATAVIGKEVDGKDVATAVEIVEFENGKVQFRITYNKDMKLEGLFIK